ncbi:MAG: hypothetical protein U0166_10425 [Acidobacteriota bacterium]
MKVHVEPTGRSIEPFGDPPSSALVLDRPLSSWQDEAIASAGLARAGALEPPCLVVPDALFASAGALRAFVDGAAGRDAVLVLKDSVFGRKTTPVQPHVVRVDAGHRFEKVRFVSGRGEPPVDVVVDPDESVLKVPLPSRFADGGALELPLPRHPVMTLHHWIHILWANQAAGAMVTRSVPRWKAAARIFLAVARSFSIDKWEVLARLNRVGRKCDIHPTAVLEGATLGNGVTVGAFARVLFSQIGDGATVMPGAHVEASTVGARATVAQGTTIRLCVLYPEAIASQETMQMCLLGRGAVTTLGSFSMDLNFEREIRVPLDGVLHGTGTRFLGSAFGHGCRVGTGIWLASGRMVPNGSSVVRDPRDVVSRIPPDLPAGATLANDGGTLRPVPPRDTPGA